MRHWIAAAPALLLIACGDGAGGGGGSAVALQPGQWETTVQFTSIEIPGAPEAAVAQMREMMSRPQTRSECITPEQAANPTGNMVSPGGNNCQFSESTFAGGTIRVRGTCQQPGQGSAQMSMEGSYTATTMQAQISSEVQAPANAPQGGPQSVRMSGTFASRRTGECAAG
jgi:hypothetical protein